MASNSHTEEEQESGSPAFSRLSILRTIWKRKVRIVLAWVVFGAIGVAVVRLIPAVYLSEAVVLIDTQKIPEKFVSATVASDLDNRMAEIRETVLSGGELKKIIDDLGLYREARKKLFDEEILDMMRKDISITLESVGSGSNNKRTAAFRIGFQGRDPALVTRVANRLTDLYVEQNLKTREAQAEGTSEFLDAQLRDAKTELDQLEAAVSSYKLQHNGELPQQEQSLSNTLSRLQTELEVNRDAVNRAQQTRVILEGNLNAMEVTLAAQQRAWEQAQHTGVAIDSAGQPVVATQKKESEVIQEKLNDLVGRYTESNPDVIRLRAQLEKAKSYEEQQRQAASSKDLAATMQPKPGAKNPSAAPEPPDLARTREQVTEIKGQIAASDKELEDRKAEQRRILGDLDQYQHHIEQLPVREQEMAKITRNYEMSKENYKSLLDKKMAAEMALDMERRQQSERFTVLDRAQVPQKPIKPKRPLLYAAAAVAGVILALVVGFSAEIRQNVVLGEWELPSGTPILARLPYIEIPEDSDQTKSPPRGRWFSRRKALVNASATASLLFIGSCTCLNNFLQRS